MTRSNVPDMSVKNQVGLSLIEVMVAMAIGVILMLGITQIFSASRAAFSSNEGLARIQENSRFAMEFIRQDLRMAGNMGCLNELGYAGNIFNHLLPPSAAPNINHWPYRLDLPVEVYEFQNTGPGTTIAVTDTRTTPAAGSWSPALPAPLVGNAYDNSDVIVVRYLSADFARLTDIVAAGGSESITVNAADASYIQPGSIYGITDCKKVSLMQVNTGGATSQGGRNQRLWDAMESDYSPFSIIHRYHFVAYFVGRGTDGAPALMRRVLEPNGNLGAAEEIVTGVESIQVMLGVNLSLRTRLIGDRPDAYMTAAQVQAGAGAWNPSTATAAQRWASVVNFRVGMLIRNDRPGASETPTNLPRIADTTVTPPQDGRMRQTYEAQVAIRNRVRD